MASKMATEDFLSKLVNKTLISRFIDRNTPVILKCDICNFEYKITPASYISNNKNACANCSMTKKRKSIDVFEKEVQTLSNGEYFVIPGQTYINNKHKLLLEHKLCGHKFYIAPNKFLIGRRCPECYGTKRLSIDTITTKMPDDYELISTEYKNTDSKLEFKHLSCGNNFYMSHHDFFPGNHRCPFCVASIGEIKIRQILTENNISFEEQKTFSDLRDKRQLRFDFYIPTLNLLIEFDGEQHYIKRHNDKDGSELRTTKYHDKLKNSFAKKRDINLLRIPFWKIKELDQIIISVLNGDEISYIKKKYNFGRFTKNKRR